MQNFIQAMKMQAAQVQSSKTFTRLGVITGYNPTEFSVTVVFQDDENGDPLDQSGWIPLTSPWIGNGWGMFAAPSIGDLISVHFQEGDLNNGFACMRFYNQVDQPLSVDSGEFWLVHSTGSFLKFTNDGKLSLNGHVEIDVTTPVLNITTTGNCNVSAGGNATINATGAATLQSATSVAITAPAVTLGSGGATTPLTEFNALKAQFDAHLHTNGNGGANTGTPTAPLGAGATSVVTAA